MSPEPAEQLPDPQICEQARISRDPRFDGLFFTAVRSTRIYCRSVCPVATVKPENVQYFATAAAAERAGFRPCLRCRPELAPGAWRRGDAALERALKLIDEGFLGHSSLAALARHVDVGERQLRRLFVARLGASPLRVHATRRLLFAKQLLTETNLAITDVALEAGFGSVRRFNASFRHSYRLAPSQLRRAPRRHGEETLTLRLDYRPPYDFPAILGVLRQRAISGVELIDGDSYARTFGPERSPGWLRVATCPGKDRALQLTLHCPASVRLLDVVTRVRRMFDLDADPRAIHQVLARDPVLRPLVERSPGLRLPGPWDGFEEAVRVLLEQQCRSAPVAVSALAKRWGRGLNLAFPAGLNRLFPTPAVLARATVNSLTDTPLPRSLAAVLRVVARSSVDAEIAFPGSGTLQGCIDRWQALTGADRRGAHAMALRALGHPDAFPADATTVRAVRGGGGGSVTLNTLWARAERWRPWRGYAFLQLSQAVPGHDLTAASTPPGTMSENGQ